MYQKYELNQCDQDLNFLHLFGKINEVYVTLAVFLMRFGFISWMSCRFQNHKGCNVSLAKLFDVLDFVWKFGGFKADHTVNCFVFIVASSVLLRHRCQLTRQHRGELLQKQNKQF